MATALASLSPLLRQRFETSNRTLLLWVRWLFFLTLLFLFLYDSDEPLATGHMAFRVGLLAFYLLSNIALTWATRARFPIERWSVPLFLVDIVLVGLLLYSSVGPDIDLYIMCFLIVYLSTLSRSLKDALPLALIACFVYGLLLYHQNPSIDWMHPQLLLRFPFFLVLALFTSYFAEQTEQDRRKIQQMEEVQSILAGELQKAMIELRNKQADLVQAEKLTAMGHMAGALAHEIRNPLSVIIGYVDDMLAEHSEEPLHKVLESIKRSAQRCFELMENLLHFSRRPKENETFRLKDAIQETMTLARASAKMTQVQCVLDVRADPLLSARRSEIQQVLINFMTNAMDAMPNGGTLTVRLEQEDNSTGNPWVKISVEDTGTGIPEDVRKHMFEAFYTTKPAGKGTGLGLSIVQDIVQSYHGLLEVQSELHRGTKMIVRFPLGDGTELSPETPA